MYIIRRYRLLRAKTGSALVSVVLVFALLLVFGTAVMSAAMVSGSVTSGQIRGQQAYFIAKAAVSSAERYISSNSGFQAKIDALKQDSPSISGNCTFNEKSSGASLIVQALNWGASGSPDYIKITGTATYNGETSSVCAYMRKTGGSNSGDSGSSDSGGPQPGVPAGLFDNVLSIGGSDGSGSSSLGDDSDYYGNILINGDVTFNGSTGVVGNVFSTGVVTINSSRSRCYSSVKSMKEIKITNDASINGDIYTNSRLTIASTSVIGGNVYAGGNDRATDPVTGNINITNTATIQGNVYGDGDLTMSNGTLQQNVKMNGNIGTSSNQFRSSTVQGYANCQLNAYLTWGASMNYLITGGRVFVPDYSNLVAHTPQQNQKYTPIQFNKLNITGVNTIYSEINTKLPDGVDCSQNYDITGNNYTITRNGTITSYNSGGCTVNIDSSVNHQDIYLQIDGGKLPKSYKNTLDLSNIKILYNSDNNQHRLYIYLTGDNTTFRLSGGWPGPILTMKDFSSGLLQNYTGAPSNIFIIGGGTQTVKLDSSSEFDGYIILPNGTLEASGNVGLNGYKLFGSAIAKNVTMSGTNKTFYYTPNLKGTPFENLGSYTVSGGNIVSGTGDITRSGSSSSSSSGGSSGTWTHVGWLNQ